MAWRAAQAMANDKCEMENGNTARLSPGYYSDSFTLCPLPLTHQQYQTCSQPLQPLGRRVGKGDDGPASVDLYL